MRVQFTLHARNELDDSMAYYELQHPGLGGRFKKEVRVVIGRILEFPDSFPAVKGSVRKAFVRAFLAGFRFTVIDSKSRFATWSPCAPLKMSLRGLTSDYY